MDVIINNPPAQSVAPGYLPAPNYVQGYGPVYGYGPAFGGPYRDHGGPGFFGVLLLILGGVLLVRFVRMRGRWEYRRRMRGVGAGGDAGTASGEDGEREPPFEGWGRDFWGRGFSADRAQRIARERFARGEIDAEQYEAIKKGLA